MMPPREMRPLPPPPQLTQLTPPPQMFFAGQLVQPSLRVPPPPPPLPPHSSFQPYYANRGDGYDRRNNDGDEDDDEDDEDRCEIPSSILEQAYISLADAVRGHIRRMASSRGNASRVPTVRFKHDVMMNSICDALHAIESEKGLFVEITPGSEAFEEVNTGLEELRYRRGTIVVLDRAWNIDSYPVRSRYYSIPPEKRGKEVLGFHSSKLSNLIGIAKEGFQVNTSEVSISTGKKEMLGRLVYTADLCRNAIKYSDEFTFCLVVTIFAGRVWETKEAMENMTVTKLRGSSFDTIHAIKVSLRGDMRAAPPERILPRQLLMFRKVRRPDLWTYIHYGLSASAASAAAAPTPNPTSTASSSPLTTTILQLKEYNRQQKRQQRQQLQQQQQQQQQPQQQQQQRQLPLPPVCPAVKKFVNKLINDTRIFWNAKLKNMWKGNPFDPVLALQTRDHVCFSSRNPASVVHLIAAPRARVRWSDMGPQSTIVVTKLYAFAVFVRAELQRVPQCPLLSILFPVCPSQDQLHCHILARSDMNARNMNLKYDNFVSAEVFIYNLAAGKYSDSWYSSKGVDPNDYYWGPSNNFT